MRAEPYSWPFDGAIDPTRTALLCIDWQADFCGPGGYVDTMGYDLSLTRRGLGPTAQALAAVRRAGWLVVHTREGHRPDRSALKMITMQGGVFGAIADSSAFMAAMADLPGTGTPARSSASAAVGSTAR